METTLFYKVFKNKYIWFKISTFLRQPNRYESFSYDELTSCEWMIMNGYIGLLKLKVSRCDRLSFNCDSGKKIPRSIGRCKYDNGNTMGIELKTKQIPKSVIYYKHSIFSIETNGQDDEISFFKLLFKNYNNFFKISEKSTSDKTIQKLLDMSIEYDNLTIIKLLVNHYNWVPTIDSFVHSFEIGSFKILNYLLPYFEDQLKRDNKEIIELLWIRSIKLTNSNDEFKLIESKVNWLVSIFGLTRVTTTTTTNTTTTNENNKIIQDILLQLFDISIMNSKVYQLIFLCKLVNIFNFQTYITTIKLNKIKSRDYQDKFILELLNENIEMLTNVQLEVIEKSFTNYQLNEMKVYQFKKDDENVKSLCGMLYKFTNPRGNSVNGNLYSNYIYYKIKYSNTLLEYRSNYHVLFDEDYISITQIKHNYSTYHYILKNSGLFKIDKQLEFEYFSNLIDYLNKTVKTTRFINELYLYAIESDNIKLVSLLCDKLPANYSEFSNPSPYSFMKSTEIFDIIYKEDTVKNNVFQQLLYNNELANHFKINHPDHFILSIQLIQEDTIYSIYGPSWSKYQFIFNNWSLFSTSVQIKLMSTIWKSIEHSEIELQEFINYFNCSINVDSKLAISNIKVFDKTGCHPNKTTFQQLYWISKQQEKYSFKMIDFTSISKSILYYFNYLSTTTITAGVVSNGINLNDIELLFNDRSVDKLNYTIYEITKRCDLNSFSQLLSFNQLNYHNGNSQLRLAFIETCLKFSIMFNNFNQFLNNLNEIDKSLISSNFYLENICKLNQINNDFDINNKL